LISIADLMPELAIHEHLSELFDRMMGRVVENPLPFLHSAMTAAFRDLVQRDEVFTYHCPIDLVVYEDEVRPGYVGWHFRVSDLKNILWISIHKDHVDRHFPAKLFPDGRPELPVYP
jgi:hypothetical protein